MSERGILRSQTCVFAVVVAGASLGGCGGDDGPVPGTVTQAVGLPPINQLPPPQTTNEDSPLIFSALGGNALGLSDGDNATSTVQIIVTNGTFTLGSITGLAVSGNGTFSVTVSGEIGAIVAGLDGAYYRPSADYNGASTLQMNTSDTNGESDLDILPITVTAFNDPPVNAVPVGAQTATEDVPRAFTLSVADVDVAGAPVLVSLTASNATLVTLPTVAGLVFTAGDGVDDAAMTFSGPLPSVNAALNGLVVTPPLDYIGASTLGITSNDQGATGAGVPGADNDTVTITWQAVNDPPVNTVPAAQALVEGATLTFSAGTGNPLSVADVDASTALVQVTLSATSGTIDLGNPGMVTFTTGDGVADATMVFNATLAGLNSALAGTSFTPPTDFTGNVTLTMATSDLGNTGSGGPRVDTDPVVIAISAVNDPPVITRPGDQATNEDVVRIFSVANGNPITVADPDATALQVTLTATNGTATLAGVVGLSFQAGDGTGDAVMTFSGTIAAINTALNGARFVPVAQFAGAAALAVAVSDLGATGVGGTLTDVETIAIVVAPVNDPPTAVNDAVTVAEDAAATAVAVLVNDSIAPDVGEVLAVTAVGAALHGATATDGTQVTYQPAADYHGPDSFTYTIGDGAGGSATGTVVVTVTSVNDPPSASDDSVAVVANSVGNTLAVLGNDAIAPDVGETLTITAVGAPLHGTATIISAATRVSYTPTAGYSGPDSFTYTITDGNGGADTATVTVDVAAVITQPVNSLPSPQTIVEDSPLFFSSAAGNALTVADANNASLTVQVLVTNGTFTLGSVVGLTVSGNGTSAVTASGPITSLNAGLNNARYNPSLDFHGAAALTLNSSDTNGESDLDVLTLAVTSFNDAPVNAVPAGIQAASEDTPRTFSTISVADVDLDGGPLLVTLTANNGTLISLGAVAGLTFTTGDGLGDATLTFAGTLASINVALNGLTVTAPANYIGPSALVITSNDQGNTGAGLAGTDTDTVNLSWASANDPPINAVPPAQTLTEDGTLTFAAAAGTGLGVSDLDAAAGTMQITLVATNGTVTLGNPAAVVFTAGDGVADVTMTFRATLAALNGALEGTSFRPNANVTGAATVTMTTSDLGNTGGAAQTDSDSVAITVLAVNDAPVITAPATSTTNEDVTRVFSSAQGNAVTIADVDAIALQVSLTASAGTLTLPNRVGLTFQAGDGTADATTTFTGTPAAINTALNGLTFIPTPQFAGTATLTMVAGDLGATGTGGPLADEEAIVITVFAVNDPPDAVADAATTAEDAPALVIDVRANDTSLPEVGETLTVTAVAAPLHGTTAITGGGTGVSYTPAANYHGADSFTYTLSDGLGGLDTATVTMTVTPVNDPPTAVADSFTVVESSANNSLAVRANDSAAPDTGETLAVVAVTMPAHGVATITGTGNATAISYTPTAGYDGADSFAYTLSDGNGGTASAVVTVTITAIDTTPVAVDDTLTVAEDVVGAVAVLGNDTGIGDAPLTLVVATPPQHGAAVVLPDQRIQYAPAADYHGPDAFTYTLTDSDGDVATGAVAVTITPVDDQPVAVADAITLDEDTAPVLLVLANDTGLGDGALVVTVVAAPAHGTATAAADGTITYTPTADFAGADELMYQVADGDGDVATGVAALTVTPLNDAPRPVADVDSTRTGATRAVDVLANDVEPDGDPLTLTAVTAPLHGTATIAVDATITYVPEAGYIGTDTFSYTVSDGQGETATAAVTMGVGTDRDGDGLLDLDEVDVHGTDPDVADTDGDLLDDGVEVNVTATDPLDDDGDDDGLLDGHEDANADGMLGAAETAPGDADSDDDDLGDGLERGLAAAEGDDTVAAMFVADADPATTTDPRRADTDGGGRADGAEDRNHNGRVDAAETDPNDATDDAPAPAGDDGGGGCCAVGGGPSDAAGALLVLLGLLGRWRRRRR